MTCDLANPIFTDEAKATAHMETDRWPDGVYCPHCGSLNVHKMAGKTHMWTAPACKGFCVCFGDLVGCGHMSGPFVRRRMAAGPDGVRGSGPHQECVLKKRVELSGSSRSTARPFRHHFLFTLAILRN